MRRIGICLLAALVLSFSACGQSAPPESSAVSISPAEKQETAISPPPSSEEPESSAAASPESPSSQEGSSTLIAYFSRAWAAWRHGIGAGEAGCQKGVSFLKEPPDWICCLGAFVRVWNIRLYKAAAGHLYAAEIHLCILRFFGTTGAVPAGSRRYHGYDCLFGALYGKTFELQKTINFII